MILLGVGLNNLYKGGEHYMETNIQFFYCYDANLFTYLSNKGFRFITKAKHYKTNDLFSMYIKTPSLSAAIDEWEQSKPKLSK